MAPGKMNPWRTIIKIGRSTKLVWKFSIAALMIIISMGAGIYFIADATIRQNLYDAHRQKGGAIVASMATNAADLLLVESSARLQLLLKNAELSDPEIVYVFIADPNGNVPAHTFSGGFPQDLKKITHPVDNQSYSSQLLKTGEGLVLDIAGPILQGSLGYVHAGFSLETIERQRRRSQRQIFLACVLASLLAVIAAVFFSRYITKPLTALAQGADFIRKGNLAHRLAMIGHGEVGLTATAFNQMVEALQRDIARRVTAEKALQESEEIYRTLVENINMGITLIDRDHTVLMANAAQGRLLRKNPDAFFGKKCFAEFEKRDHVCPHCPGVAAMKSGRPTEAIVQGKLDDGSTLTVNIKAFPVQDEKGQNKRFIEVVEDISEKLATQQSLAAEKERLAVTLRSIGDGVITTDISGNIVLLNKVAEGLTGWSNEEAMGRPLAEVFHIINEQTREACENPVTEVMNSGQIVGLANHTVLVARDGTELRIADSGAPIRDAQSNIIGVVLAFRDVTQQIQTEKELLKIEKLESIGVLAGGIAHDFNNILAAILGNINLALFDKALTDKTKKLLLEAEKASFRAKDLTQQLLTFAKGGEPVKETSALEDVIKDSANFVLHGDNVACRFDIPGDLWLVDIDKGQIGQVVQNLVLNASQAMPAGGFITINCENYFSAGRNGTAFGKKKRFVKVDIRDTGIGMPANVVEKIFDPYFSTRRNGSGLGLAVSHSIVSKHGGHITVDSTPGVGTTFAVYLPASAQSSISSETIKETGPAAKKANILVMDDEEQVRKIVHAMLGRMGHEVVLAKDGEDAVRFYQESLDSGTSIDLTIMDLTIPGGMGGKEAVREIIRINPQAKVIVSSGYSTDPVMASFQDHGFCGALVKPYRTMDLANILATVLGESESQDGEG